MIVISGALVLVALVLLIFGITTTDLDFVYASIVVSLVSFVFLLIGILQRRGDRGSDIAPASAATSASAAAASEPVDEGVTAVVPRVRTPAGGSTRIAQPVDKDLEEPATEELDVVDEAEAVAGTVLVVPGRPRYHVAGCRYLTGKSATEVDVADARDEGFSPCGVCKPDDALAAAGPVEEPLEPDAAEEPVADEDPVVEDVPGAVEVEPVAAAPARRTRSSAAVKRAPAKRAPRTPRAQPSAAAVAASADPTTDAVLETVANEAPAASAKTAAADGASTATVATLAPEAPAAPARAGRRTSTVIVIPDRGKFHRAECRYVRNASDTSTMSRTNATKQGYDACGVCKP